MTSQLLFTAVIALVALERVAELWVSRRNAAWSLAQGGQEHGREHYSLMVALHAALLGGSLAEVWLLDRPFVALLAALAMLGVVWAQGLRWWCIATLGRQWNTRVIVVPGAERVRGGPYRFLDHPNYVAVIAEGIALPLIHGAWVTAVAFTVLNAALLRERIRVEDEALAALAEQGERSQADADTPAVDPRRKRARVGALDETGEAELPPKPPAEPKSGAGLPPRARGGRR